MTSRTKLITLSTVFVVLLVTYIVGSVVTSRAGRSPVAGDPVVSEDVISDTHTIRLSAGGTEPQSSVLHRSGDAWEVEINEGLYPADANRVEGFLDALRSLGKVRIAADDAEYHEDFDVAGDAARVATLLGQGEEELARLVFGKAVSGGGRIYARRADADRVFVVDRDVGFYFGQNAPYWSDLAPLPADLTPQAVVRITVDADLQIDEERRVTDRFTVLREAGQQGGGTWRIDAGGGNQAEELDQQAADDYAANLTELEAAGFVTEEEVDTGLETPAATVTFEDASGRQYVVEVGNAAGESRFYMRVTGDNVDTAEDGRPFLYTVSAYQVGRILKGRDALTP
jgi:hypothetical protein